MIRKKKRRFFPILIRKNLDRRIALTLILAIILFCLSFFYAKNEICCMFASNRYRGFPYQIISIYKETDDIEEAEKVYSLNDFELLSQGWKLKVNRGFNPPWAVPFNLIFYLAVGRGLVFAIGRTKTNL